MLFYNKNRQVLTNSNNNNKFGYLLFINQMQNTGIGSSQRMTYLFITR